MRRPGEGIVVPAYKLLSMQNQVWIECRLAWIVEQFGRDYLRNRQTVLPNEILGRHSAGDFQALCKDVAASLDLNATRITYSLARHDRRFDGGFDLGLYFQENDEHHISIDESLMDDREGLLSTLVHELCHVHLLGHGRLSDEEADHEPLTDLLCVAMGYGVCVSNKTVVDVYHQADISHKQPARSGYLTMPMYGYSLALVTHLKGENFRTWKRNLRLDVRDAFVKSYRHLEKRGLPDLARAPNHFEPPDIYSAAEAPSTYQSGLLERLYPSDSHFEISDPDEPDFDTTPAEDGIGTNCIYCQAPAIPGDEVCSQCKESIDEGHEEYLREKERRESMPAFDLKLIGAMILAGLGLWIVISLMQGCTN